MSAHAEHNPSATHRVDVSLTTPECPGIGEVTGPNDPALTLMPDGDTLDCWVACKMCDGEGCEYCDGYGHQDPVGARCDHDDLREADYAVQDLYAYLKEEPSNVRQNEWELARGIAAHRCLIAWGVREPLTPYTAGDAE